VILGSEVGRLEIQGPGGQDLAWYGCAGALLWRADDGRLIPLPAAGRAVTVTRAQLGAAASRPAPQRCDREFCRRARTSTAAVSGASGVRPFPPVRPRAARIRAWSARRHRYDGEQGRATTRCAPATARARQHNGPTARSERNDVMTDDSTRGRLPGLHHVTAITADAQQNIDFYGAVLGLRFVKLTVNFDDPRRYHLYYGDELGRPGTALTFFAWPGALRGRVGPPQVTTTSLAVPAGSLGFWRERLERHGVAVTPEITRFGAPVLGFVDPDGLRLELVGTVADRGTPWAAGPVPAELAIRGFAGVTLGEVEPGATAALLTNVLGFAAVGREGERQRFEASDTDGFAATVDLVRLPDGQPGAMGAGVVHHVAFRTPDDARQEEWRAALREAGLDVTPLIDRTYFHSIYFREPGGVLFEIATEGPGFTVDEPPEELGSALRLPQHLEPRRAEIERGLPPVELPRRPREPLPTDRDAAAHSGRGPARTTSAR
jgi:glyoxalase family protein